MTDQAPTVTMTKRQAATLAAWASFGRCIAYELWGTDMPICRQLAPLDMPITVADTEPYAYTAEEIEP